MKQIGNQSVSIVSPLLMIVAVLCSVLLPSHSQAAQPPLSKPVEEIKLGSSCLTSECHVKMGKKKFSHGPMKFNKCDPCHVPVGNRHVFEKLPSGRSHCLECHVLEDPKHSQHKPFLEDCTLCHEVHESDNRYFVKGGTGREGCLNGGCHEDFQTDFAFSHAPLEKGGCLLCHSPHQSDHDKLLTNSSGELCILCHTEISEVPLDATSVHEPYIRKECISCHSPHGEETRFLVPADEKQFCGNCHEEIFDQAENLKFPHGAMTEKKKCRNCHNPHFSDQSHLLKGPVADLCLDCHNKPIKTKERVIKNMALMINNAFCVHGPIRNKNCVACHRAHGSNLSNILLQKAFPLNIYGSGDQNLYSGCFDCHNRTCFEKDRSELTNFRNGSNNLHNLHVVGEKGHNCQFCHNVHVSNQPELIRDKSPFGNWEIPIKYSKTLNGGTCLTACHPLHQYNRIFPVDNDALIKGASFASLTKEMEKKQTDHIKTTPSSSLAQSIDPKSTDESWWLQPGELSPSRYFQELNGKVYHQEKSTSPTLLLFLNPSDSFTRSFLKEFQELLVEDPSLANQVHYMIVLSSVMEIPSMEFMKSLPGKPWRVFKDSRDKIFSAYRVTATPASFILGPDLRIRYICRGYCFEMLNHIKHDLYSILGRKIQVPLPWPHISPNLLTSHLASRLAERGLWERSLENFIALSKKETLPLWAELEMAEIYLKMEKPEEAKTLLTKLKLKYPKEESVSQLIQRISEKKPKGSETPKPPKVTR